MRRVVEAAPQRDLGDRHGILARVLEIASTGLEPLREHVAGHAGRLVAEGVVEMAAAAVDRQGDGLHRQRRIAQAARHHLLDALAQRLALGGGALVPGQLEQRQVHQLHDRLADPARGIGGDRGQLLPGAPHGLQGQPRDAAARAQRPRHQLAQRQAALEQRRLGHHHDEVLHPRRVGHLVAVGGVVDAPLARRHPGAAAHLLDLGAAAVGRHDLQVADLARAHQAVVLEHAVTVGFQPGEHHVAGALGGHVAVEVDVAVQVGLQAAEEPADPLRPAGGAVARGHLVGAHRRREAGHADPPVSC